MADKIDMSLDDIIKINKKKGIGAKTRTTNPKAARSKIRPRVPPAQARKAQPQRQQRQQLQTSPAASKDPGQTMLHVSNLDFGVSNKDLKELFEEVGPIKKASVHYDRSGRSLGTAEVVFWKRDAAVRAIKEYNMRILDGRPMSIALVPSRTANPVSTATKVTGVKKGSGIQKRSPQKMGGSRLKNQSQSKSPRKNVGAVARGGPRKSGKPGTRQPKKEISAQQLDDDLEAYKNQMVVD